MKLSDMMHAVTDYSKTMEEKLAEWEGDAETWANEAKNRAEAWTSEAKERMAHAEQRFDAYVAEANDTARAEWDKAQGQLEEQMSTLQTKSDTLRDSIQNYSQDTQADAAEAYAAAMTKFAVFAQSEAEKAMAFAASKSDTPDT